MAAPTIGSPVFLSPTRPKAVKGFSSANFCGSLKDSALTARETATMGLIKRILSHDFLFEQCFNIMIIVF
jgi:hypothetical protein